MTAEEAIAKTSTELKKRMKDSPSIQKLLRRINSGKATFADTAEYSNQVALMVGDVLSDCVRDPQTAKFSGRVAEALLKEQYEEINSVMQTVQTALDKQRGLHIAAQKAAMPLDRIKAAAYSLVDVKATAEQLVRRAESAPVTVVRSYHDQYIHENAMFRSSAGLRCFLVRTTDGKCCEWCSAKAGRYEYGEHPEDIFRRHDNCGCTVTYENGRQRQNVWSKEKWEVPEAGAGAPKPTILNYAQGKELQAKNMQYRGLTSPAQSGIIRSSGTGVGSTKHRFEYVSSINPTDERSVAQMLRDFEQRYQSSEVEHCRVITSIGEVYDVHGDKFTVDTSLLGDKLKGSINEHNHVIGESQYSFSKEDLESCAKDGSKIAIAFDEKYRYTMVFPDGPLDENAVYAAYQQATENVGDDLIFNPQTIQNGDEQHERIRRACDLLGIEYSRVPVSD